SPYGPPASLKFAADDTPPYRIRLAIRNPSTGPDSAIPDLELWSGSLIEPDIWYAVIVYVKPRLDGSGGLKLWIGHRVRRLDRLHRLRPGAPQRRLRRPRPQVWHLSAGRERRPYALLRSDRGHDDVRGGID